MSRTQTISLKACSLEESKGLSLFLLMRFMDVHIRNLDLLECMQVQYMWHDFKNDIPRCSSKFQIQREKLPELKQDPH